MNVSDSGARAAKVMGLIPRKVNYCNVYFNQKSLKIIDFDVNKIIINTYFSEHTP